LPLEGISSLPCPSSPLQPFLYVLDEDAYQWRAASLLAKWQTRWVSKEKGTRRNPRVPDFKIAWYPGEDSNLRPQDPESCALSKLSYRGTDDPQYITNPHQMPRDWTGGSGAFGGDPVGYGPGHQSMAGGAQVGIQWIEVQAQRFGGRLYQGSGVDTG
jgi:hypothetical protein